MLKIAHIALSVSDLERSVSFYQKHFGFECIEKTHDEAVGLQICTLKKDAAILELFKFQEFDPLPEYRKDLTSDLKTLGIKHLAFEVDNIESEFERLKKAGVEFATDIEVLERGLKYFFIKDPDGIFVELIEVK